MHEVTLTVTKNQGTERFGNQATAVLRLLWRLDIVGQDTDHSIFVQNASMKLCFDIWKINR